MAPGWPVGVSSDLQEGAVVRLAGDDGVTFEQGGFGFEVQTSGGFGGSVAGEAVLLQDGRYLGLKIDGGEGVGGEAGKGGEEEAGGSHHFTLRRKCVRDVSTSAAP